MTTLVQQCSLVRILPRSIARQLGLDWTPIRASLLPHFLVQTLAAQPIPQLDRGMRSTRSRPSMSEISVA